MESANKLAYYALVSFPRNPVNPDKRYVFRFDSFMENKPFDKWVSEINQRKIKAQTKPDGPFDAVLVDVLWAAGEDPDFDVAAAFNATLPIKPLYGVRYCVTYVARPEATLETIPLNAIQVPWSFRTHFPRPDTFAAHYEAFTKALNQREKFTEPLAPGTIKVRRNGSTYILTDGYCSFLLYRAFGYQSAVVSVLDSPPAKAVS